MTQVAQQDREVVGQERLVIGSADIAAAPSSVLVAPWGEVRSSNGTFVMDEEGARLVLAAFTDHGTDIPIDYEHQSLGGAYASPSGQAPAAGWIKSLSFLPPEQAGDGPAGLVAEVAWTEPAREKLAAREYRYLSPVVIVRQSDRRMIALHSAALTNKPAIVNARPIVNKAGQAEGATVGLAGVSESLDHGPAIDLLRARLELPADADLHRVLALAEQRLADLSAQAAAIEADRRVQAALAEGKLTPAQREWAVQLALKDPPAFDEWAASAPRVVAIGRTREPARAGGGGRDRAAVALAAKAAYRAEPALASLTSESAWVSEALRQAGFDPRPAEGSNAG